MFPRQQTCSHDCHVIDHVTSPGPQSNATSSPEVGSRTDTLLIPPMFSSIPSLPVLLEWQGSQANWQEHGTKLGEKGVGGSSLVVRAQQSAVHVGDERCSLPACRHVCHSEVPDSGHAAQASDDRRVSYLQRGGYLVAVKAPRLWEVLDRLSGKT